jgi:predicted peptidase
LKLAGRPEAAAQCIVVAPQLPVGGDIWYRHADAVWHIVNEVQQDYDGDPDRTYLTGFSFGGNGVFDLAVMQPEFWAALWAVDLTRVPDVDPLCPLWLFFGEVSRYRKDRFTRALELMPADTSTKSNRLYLDQGQDHVGSATLAYRDTRIYAWLLSKRLGN